MADIVIPSAWVGLSEEGLERTVMIIGASGRNKSTPGLPTTSNLALLSEESRPQAVAPWLVPVSRATIVLPRKVGRSYSFHL